MDNTTGITPVMPIGTGYGDGFSGGFGGGFWIFALLILFMMGGNGGGIFGNNNALQNDINRGFDNQNLQAQTRDILAAVTSGTAQTVAATNQTFHDSLSAMQSLYNETARDIASLAVGQANLLANQNECCCGTKQLIMQGNYDTAMQLAGIESRLSAKMDANTIQGLRDQVDALRDQVNMSGVLRFPNSWSYGAGPFPPIFGNCAYANI